MADKRYEGGWDPSYRNFEDDEPSFPDPIWDFDSEISQLEKDLNTKIVVQKEESHEISDGLRGEDLYCRSGEPAYRKVIDKPQITEPDIKKRDISKNRLIEIYNDSHSIAKHLAGRVLSRNRIGNYPYSKTRVFVHEDPIASMAGVFVTTGVVAGIGSFIYHYLTR